MPECGERLIGDIESEEGDLRWSNLFRAGDLTSEVLMNGPVLLLVVGSNNMRLRELSASETEGAVEGRSDLVDWGVTGLEGEGGEKEKGISLPFP